MSVTGPVRWLLCHLLAILLYCCLIPPSLLFAAETKRRVLPFATQEIRYHMLEASEVFLIWWLNDGHIVPEELHPPGTVRKDGALYTPMTYEDDTFVVRLQVPMGTIIRYVFQITKARGGAALERWDTDGDLNRRYQLMALPDSVANVRAGLQLMQDWPLATQEIRYHMPEANAVLLVWGIDDWTVIPETFHPSGTIAKGALLHTPMVRVGDTFATTVSLPLGAGMYYGFEITEIRGGVSTALWDADSERDYHLIVSQNSVVEVQTKLTPDELHAFTGDSNNRRIWLLVISGIVGPGIGLWYVVRTRRRQRRRRRHTRRSSEWSPAGSAEATPAPTSAELSEMPNVAFPTPAPRVRRHRRVGKWTTLLFIFRGRRRHRYQRHRRHASRYD
jgi:hypothetical protein